MTGRIYYELQAQERPDEIGFVLTTTVSDSNDHWTTPWCCVPEATSLEEAHKVGVDQARKLHYAMQGCSDPGETAS